MKVTSHCNISSLKLCHQLKLQIFSYHITVIENTFMLISTSKWLYLDLLLDLIIYDINKYLYIYDLKYLYILITVLHWFPLESNGFYFIPSKTFQEEVHRLWQAAKGVHKCQDSLVTPYLLLLWLLVKCPLGLGTDQSRMGESGHGLPPLKVSEKALMVRSEICPLVAGRQNCEIEPGLWNVGKVFWYLCLK